MADRRLSVWMSPPLEAVIANRDDPLSQRLSAVAARYRWVCEAHKPDLSDPEWNVLRDVLNGYWLFDDDGQGVLAIPAEIIDADLYEHTGDKWGVDCKALAQKVQQMTMAESISMIEAVETWWAQQ